MASEKKMVKFDDSTGTKSSTSQEDIDDHCYKALFKEIYKTFNGEPYVMQIVHKAKEHSCYVTLKIKCSSSSPSMRFVYECKIVGDDFWTQDEDRAIQNVFLKAYLTLKRRFYKNTA